MIEIPYFSGLVYKYIKTGKVLCVGGANLRESQKGKKNKVQNRERDGMCRGSRAIGTRGKYVERSFREF